MAKASILSLISLQIGADFPSMQKSRWEQLNQLSGRSKWLLAGGVVVIVLLLQITTFYMGYNQGWDEGSATPPQQVILQSDEKAMKTLAEFMADSVSGPDALIDLIQHRNERLAWIHDEELRADVAWGLPRCSSGQRDQKLWGPLCLLITNHPLPFLTSNVLLKPTKILNTSKSEFVLCSLSVPLICRQG
jgi:hypothetical protein